MRTEHYDLYITGLPAHISVDDLIKVGLHLLVKHTDEHEVTFETNFQDSYDV